MNHDQSAKVHYGDPDTRLYPPVAVVAVGRGTGTVPSGDGWFALARAKDELMAMYMLDIVPLQSAE